MSMCATRVMIRHVERWISRHEHTTRRSGARGADASRWFERWIELKNASVFYSAILRGGFIESDVRLARSAACVTVYASIIFIITCVAAGYSYL